MDKCRSCGADLAPPFLSLGSSPLANALLLPDQAGKMEPTFPLDLRRCETCHLVQIDDCERADVIFAEDYLYFSSFSESWLIHSQQYVAEVIDRFGLGADSFVVEVASNDGYLLQYFKQAGVPLLGIEPSGNVARAAQEKGIPTDIAFFNRAYAETMVDRAQRADLLVGNNVLAHNPDLNAFVSGIAHVLAPAGVVTMEFPHLLRLMAGNQFDTVYHEHYSYLSLHAVDALFQRHGLDIFDVQELGTHGGSLRIFAQRRDSGPHAETEAPSRVRQDEQNAGLLQRATYDAFKERVARTKRRLLTFLIEAKEAGKRVVGYGAPAKGTTLLNYCGVRTDLVEYTVDRNPHKQGRLLPGVRIPVHPPERILHDRPDYVLILPWNIADEIVAQMAEVREWGGRFVVAIPELTVLQ